CRPAGGRASRHFAAVRTAPPDGGRRVRRGGQHCVHGFPRGTAAPLIPIVVMGPSGCGKTTLATALARRLGWPFIEGDTLHPASNVEKMSAGVPLTDADREPFLDS